MLDEILLMGGTHVAPMNGTHVLTSQQWCNGERGTFGEVVISGTHDDDATCGTHAQRNNSILQ